MPKLQSPFKRALIDNRYVLTDTPDPYMDWFFTSPNLIAVEKLDGTNVSIIIEGGKIVRAYNRLNPIPIEPNNRLYSGIDNSLKNELISPYIANLPDGQHFGELIGPGIQENAMNLKEKLWIPFNSFGRDRLTYKFPALEFDRLEPWMKEEVRSLLFPLLHPDTNKSIIPEGVVFHDTVTGQMAKLRSDMYQFWYDDPSHRPHKFLQEKPKANKEPSPLQVDMAEHSKLKGTMPDEEFIKKCD